MESREDDGEVLVEEWSMEMRSELDVPDAIWWWIAARGHQTFAGRGAEEEFLGRIS
jgi:hypothetical protein